MQRQPGSDLEFAPGTSRNEPKQDLSSFSITASLGNRNSYDTAVGGAGLALLAAQLSPWQHRGAGVTDLDSNSSIELQHATSTSTSACREGSPPGSPARGTASISPIIFRSTPGSPSPSDLSDLNDESQPDEPAAGGQNSISRASSWASEPEKEPTKKCSRASRNTPSIPKTSDRAKSTRALRTAPTSPAPITAPKSARLVATATDASQSSGDRGSVSSASKETSAILPDGWWRHGPSPSGSFNALPNSAATATAAFSVRALSRSQDSGSHGSADAALKAAGDDILLQRYSKAFVNPCFARRAVTNTPTKRGSGPSPDGSAAPYDHQGGSGPDGIRLSTSALNYRACLASHGYGANTCASADPRTEQPMLLVGGLSAGVEADDSVDDRQSDTPTKSQRAKSRGPASRDLLASNCSNSTGTRVRAHVEHSSSPLPLNGTPSPATIARELEHTSFPAERWAAQRQPEAQASRATVAAEAAAPSAATERQREQALQVWARSKAAALSEKAVRVAAWSQIAHERPGGGAKLLAELQALQTAVGEFTADVEAGLAAEQAVKVLHRTEDNPAVVEPMVGSVAYKDARWDQKVRQEVAEERHNGTAVTIPEELLQKRGASPQEEEQQLTGSAAEAERRAAEAEVEARGRFTREQPRTPTTEQERVHGDARPQVLPQAYAAFRLLWRMHQTLAAAESARALEGAADSARLWPTERQLRASHEQLAQAQAQLQARREQLLQARDAAEASQAAERVAVAALASLEECHADAQAALAFRELQLGGASEEIAALRGELEAASLDHARALGDVDARAASAEEGVRAERCRAAELEAQLAQLRGKVEQAVERPAREAAAPAETLRQQPRRQAPLLSDVAQAWSPLECHQAGTPVVEAGASFLASSATFTSVVSRSAPSNVSSPEAQRDEGLGKGAPPLNLSSARFTTNSIAAIGGGVGTLFQYDQTWPVSVASGNVSSGSSFLAQPCRLGDSEQDNASKDRSSSDISQERRNAFGERATASISESPAATGDGVGRPFAAIWQDAKSVGVFRGDQVRLSPVMKLQQTDSGRGGENSILDATTFEGQRRLPHATASDSAADSGEGASAASSAGSNGGGSAGVAAGGTAASLLPPPSLPLLQLPTSPGFDDTTAAAFGIQLTLQPFNTSLELAAADPLLVAGALVDRVRWRLDLLKKRVHTSLRTSLSRRARGRSDLGELLALGAAGPSHTLAALGAAAPAKAAVGGGSSEVAVDAAAEDLARFV